MTLCVYYSFLNVCFFQPNWRFNSYVLGFPWSQWFFTLAFSLYDLEKSNIIDKFCHFFPITMNMWINPGTWAIHVLCRKAHCLSLTKNHYRKKTLILWQDKTTVEFCKIVLKMKKSRLKLLMGILLKSSANKVFSIGNYCNSFFYAQAIGLLWQRCWFKAINTKVCIKKLYLLRKHDQKKNPKQTRKSIRNVVCWTDLPSK